MYHSSVNVSWHCGRTELCVTGSHSSYYFDFLILSISCPSWIFPRIVGTTGENLYVRGGTGWYMDLFTNHSKPC